MALQDMIGAPVSAVGVGPRRDQTLQLRPLA
jgi:adenylosuccinate synthase